MRRVIAAATPIALSYIPIGVACGVLGTKCGLGPGLAAVLSATIISGGAQFMISNMWFAGLPAATIVASVCAVSLRFALYSASLAPYLQRTQANRTRHGAHAITIATWVASVAAGAALGEVVDVPTAIASFALTALFIYLLWDQLQGGPPARRAVRSSDRNEFPGFSCRVVAYIRGHPRMPHDAHICPSRARVAK